MGMTAQEQSRVQEERQRVAKAKVMDSMVIDPILKVKFMNIEDPPSQGKPSPPLSFTYGRWVFKESHGPEDGPDTALRHGNVYNLPTSVVNHLNSLSVPIYSTTTQRDETTGLVKIVNVKAGERNRFSCVPVDMTNFHQVNVSPDAQVRRGMPAPPKVVKPVEEKKEPVEKVDIWDPTKSEPKSKYSEAEIKVLDFYALELKLDKTDKTHNKIHKEILSLMEAEKE